MRRSVGLLLMSRPVSDLTLQTFQFQSSKAARLEESFLAAADRLTMKQLSGGVVKVLEDFFTFEWSQKTFFSLSFNHHVSCMRRLIPNLSPSISVGGGQFSVI